ncbi:GA-binding protein alpha chain [Platichthys flesus]|uniref:GA-binding protein alpha chain n=1 Tax=Platichthys flesus TaxID=8260 RepID=UPI002DB9B333|nr:GA-binding protein alpha chain [Platichthys flesus]
MSYLYQNSLQDAQSDLEVILEFLEEYYRQSSADNENSTEHLSFSFPPSKITKATPEPFLARDAHPALGQNPAAAAPEGGSLPNCASARQTTKRPATAAGSGKKIRLFHFLFEMLEDPGMAHCVSWVPAAAGVFRFSSKNKDQVAVLWGQRKGNKRPMTYQKMSRALRNYARSGEIFKVKKKLTYQFSLDTLTSLQRCRRGDV